MLAHIFQYTASFTYISKGEKEELQVKVQLRTHCKSVIDFLRHVVCNQLNLVLCDVLHGTDKMWFALLGPWGATALWGSAYLEHKDD